MSSFIEKAKNINNSFKSIKVTPDRQSNPWHKGQYWGYYHTDLRLHYGAIVIQTSWYWHRNRYIAKGNRVKNLD